MVVAAVGRQGVDSLCSLFYLLLLQAAPTTPPHYCCSTDKTRPTTTATTTTTTRTTTTTPNSQLATHNYQLRNTTLVLVVQLVEEVSGSSGGVAG